MIIWISGGSSGIGRALIESVPWPGARVIDISRSGHPHAEHLAVDLADPASWDVVANSFDGALRSSAEGSRAVFVHCAATLEPVGYAGESDPADYRRQILLNATAPLVLGDAFVRAVSQFRSVGELVLVSSGASEKVSRGWSGYGPAKAAVNHWVRTVGKEREDRGSTCRVVAVSPGPVDTAMQERIRNSQAEHFPRAKDFTRLHAEGQLTNPMDTADAIWKLLSEGDVENGAILDTRTRS